MKLIGLLFTLTILTPLYAQENKGLSVNINVGFSLPVGSYTNDNAEEAAIYRQEGIRAVIGFDKGITGFAKTGYFYTLDVQYSLKKIFFGIGAGQLTNPVNDDKLTKFLNELYQEQEVIHDDYNITYFTPFLGYTYRIAKMDISLSLLAGYSRSKYPYYKSILLYTISDSIWAHDGPTPDLDSLMAGGSLAFIYHFSTGIYAGFSVTYRQANYDYSMSLRTIPGGSQNDIIYDVLKVRVINTGIKVGYRFGI